ncbi:GGDEF domain-containing protein [Sulfurimicrobium lacus]|uniref:diguanylate cyclase n=1 Tax=Sulfurimicrobium lacus TaxID=2715678 RepID=A0A6F8VAZ2_9PROT|nr:diguanylate cyclase [Sulfurimicrobium lacus]BCB26878.1 GGDEF domain-containing protein [Sulfurimicrobium lacus]
MKVPDSLSIAAKTTLKRIFASKSYAGFPALLSAHEHSPLLSRRRAEIISSRVRLVAGAFAVLTPLWIIIDVLAFPWPIMAMLMAGRIVTSAAFILLALYCRGSSDIRIAYRGMAAMFAIPTAFFLFSHPLLSHYQMAGMADAIAAGYAFLPFVMAAGLSVFPLTAKEGLAFATPILLSEGVVAVMQVDMLSWSSHLGAFWLLFLITSVATLAGMSQLSFMSVIVEHSARDSLTGALNRLSGVDLLDFLFHLAKRNDEPLSVVFFDLDNFKKVNDFYGHTEGDRVLARFSSAVKKNMRKSDLLLRWGGEEFILVLPNASCDIAMEKVAQLRKQGFGLRPDNLPQTASFGIAEYTADNAKTWDELVAIADLRMYQAKSTGKDAVVGCGT